MKDTLLKKIFVKKNVIIILISVFISIFSMLTYSMANYSKNKNFLKIYLNPNDVVHEIKINKNIMSLEKFESVDLNILKDENNSNKKLVCINPCIIDIDISVIDNIELKFNSNDVIVKLDNEVHNLSNCSFSRINNVFNITLESISKISIFIFIISFVIIYFTLFLFVDILNKIKENQVKILDIVLLITICFLIYMSTVFYLMIINKFLVVIPAVCMLGFIAYYFKFNFNNWQNLYLCIAMVIGSIMIFIIPPGNVPDEPAHFIRSFVEYNRYVHDENDNVKLPKSFESLMYKYTHNVHNINEKYSGNSYVSEIVKDPEYLDLTEQYASYENTKYLSFLPYFPSGIVNFLCRLINLPIYVVFLLSRLINFIISTILCYYAIKTTPRFKKIFLIVSLFPIFLQQAAGIDMDYLTNAVSFIFIALILKFVYEDIKIRKKEILILIGIGLALALCKFGYFFLLLLIFLIPNKNFKNKKIAIIFKCLFILIPIVIAYFFNFGSVSTLNNKSDYYTVEKVLANPFNSFKICFKTFVSRFELDIFRGLIDGFGWSTKYHFGFILGTISSIFIVLLFAGFEDIKIKKKERIIMLIVFAIILIMLYAIAFTEWTPITSNQILGLQSRYFIPITLLFYISISNNMLKLNVKNKYKFYYILLSIALLLSVISIQNGFY